MDLVDLEFLKQQALNSVIKNKISSMNTSEVIEDRFSLEDGECSDSGDDSHNASSSTSPSFNLNSEKTTSPSFIMYTPDRISKMNHEKVESLTHESDELISEYSDTTTELDSDDSNYISDSDRCWKRRKSHKSIYKQRKDRARLLKHQKYLNETYPTLNSSHGDYTSKLTKHHKEWKRNVHTNTQVYPTHGYKENRYQGFNKKYPSREYTSKRHSYYTPKYEPYPSSRSNHNNNHR